MNDSERQIVDLYLDGALPESEHASLFQRLEAAPEALAYLASRTQLNVDLRRSFQRRKLQQMAVASAAASTPQDSLKRVRAPWLSWHPLTAAAAGIVFGMLCASVVFAYVAPSLGKGVSLLDESFESAPAPLVTGVPVEPGHWSGDYTEVVGEQQGVTPASGGKMLRILSADFEGKPEGDKGRGGDIYRLIDLRPYRQEFADGSAVVQVSAAFNVVAFAEGKLAGRMAIFAFDAETVANGSLRASSTPLRAWDESCLAAAFAGPVKLDRAPATWQRLTGDLRLPANSDFLMVSLLIPAGREASGERGFAGHYIDDVRVTLRHSPAK